MSSRYYDSSEVEIKPGKISHELREALGLPDNEVPVWIYRMRALGYPPGWLKKAVVDTSDIFDTEPDNGSDSKKRKSLENDQIQYDHSKLIDYPGFNSPMPKGCIDYHYYINMPAMLEHQQLEYAKRHMNSFTAAPIPKRIRTDEAGKSQDQSLSNDTSSRTDEMNHLEDPESPDSEDSAADNSKKSAKNKGLIKSKSSVSLPEEIKLVSKGSPMPKPVERAPLEKFSQGVVGELLYFENLPQSTGKFECIRGLLNTIRGSKSDADTSYQAPKDD